MQLDHRSSPGFTISRTAHLLRSAVRGAMQDANWDVSPEETQALIVLGDARRPLSMGEFAELMVRDATTLKRQLDGLVEKRFVEREPADEDGRVVMVSLTSSGRRSLQRILPVMDQVRRQALSGLSRRDVETTVRTLQRMQRNLMLGAHSVT